MSNHEMNNSPIVDESQNGVKEEGFLSTLVQRMHPRHCLDLDPTSYCGTPEQLDLAIPPLVAGIQQERSKKRRRASLEKLYDLSSLEHKENRIPLIANADWKVVAALLQILREDDENRRTACLLLNNLSLPFESKSILVENNDLLNTLLAVIQKSYPESYLCIHCLLNLSVLEQADAKVKLMNYKSNNADGQSLLQTLESVMTTYTPYVFESQLSVEREAVRYSIGLVRHLTTHKGNAVVLSRQTQIPKLLLENFIRDSPNPLARWKPDSIEDYSLLVLMHLAQSSESIRVLRELGAEAILSKLQNQEGIHAMRASTIVFAIQATNDVASI